MNTPDMLAKLQDLLSNPKLTASAVATGLGTAVALIRNSAAFFGGRSLATKAKAEKDGVVKTMDLLAKLKDRKTQSGIAAYEKLDEELEVKLDRLSALAGRMSRIRKGPHSDLTFLQRLLILFRPDGLRARVVHVLAYVFMAAMPVCLFAQNYLKRLNFDPELPADTIVLACYGALVFRAWALAERRWTHGCPPERGVLKAIFVLRKPANRQILAAQVCMWASLFWMIDSLEDMISDVAQHHQILKEDLFALSVPLLGVVISRTWAAAEFRHRESGPARRLWLSIFHLPQRASRRISWTTISWAAGLIVPVSFAGHFFSEPLHKIAFVLQWMIVCMTCNQWTMLRLLFRQPGECPTRGDIEMAA